MGAKDKLPELIEQIEQDAYQRGLADGLSVVERIIGWLTWQPQTKRMAQIEQWARNAMAQVNEAPLSNPSGNATKD